VPLLWITAGAVISWVCDAMVASDCREVKWVKFA
jgi:hypothetical protein